MVKWRDCKLGDLLEVKHGFAFLGEHFGSTGTHVVLTPGNFLEKGGFKEQLQALNEELETLNAQARTLEQTIAANVAGILEA